MYRSLERLGDLPKGTVVLDAPCGAALVELARCLRHEGRMVGSTLVRHARDRADRILERESARPGGMMGPGGTTADLEQWLHDAGLGGVEMVTGGALAVFSARR